MGGCGAKEGALFFANVRPKSFEKFRTFGARLRRGRASPHRDDQRRMSEEGLLFFSNV